MERQYIGARYVPILGGAWDRNKSYEALTIVQANNNSYTSKKHVPPDVDITNSEYWVITGNFNGQVEEYRQQVVECQQQVDELSDKIATINSNIAMKGFTDRTFVFYGDSYQEGVGSSGKSWLKILAENTGLTSDHYYNIYHGGYGFVGTAGTYENLIRESLKTITEEKRNEVTDVVISGGYNDWNASEAALSSAIKTVSGILRENFKNARYWLLPFAHCDNENIDLVRFACTRWTTIGMDNGFSVPANCQAILANSKWMNTNDYFHPNDAGHRQLAQQVFNCLSTGSANVKIKPEDVKFTASTEIFNTTEHGMFCSQDNSNIWVSSINSLLLIAKNAEGVSTLCDGNTAIELGSLTPIPFETFAAARTVSTCVPFTFQDAGGAWSTVMCTLALIRGKLYAYPNYSATSGWITLNWKQIYIPPFTITPTTY